MLLELFAQSCSARASGGLTTLSEDDVEDTLVIDFPEIKFKRHRYFTMRKRVQNAGNGSIHNTLEGREERFVHDRLYKMSRHIVGWSRQFETLCIVFEDPKEMSDSINYGTRMNRRLHHFPFRALQFYLDSARESRLRRA